MPKDRFFTDSIFEKNKVIPLPEEETHHLTHVMRRKKADTIDLINGKNQLAIGKIESIEKKKVKVLILSVEESLSKKKESLILCQALCQANHLDWIVEKCVELGVDQFRFFEAKNSPKQQIRKERIQKIIISALKQSGRLDMPIIEEKKSISECFDPNTFSLFGDIREEAPLLLNLDLLNKPIALFIGPEAGFSEDEVGLLEKHAKGIKLHDNILRSETAAICGISLLYQMQQNLFLKNL